MDRNVWGTLPSSEFSGPQKPSKNDRSEWSVWSFFFSGWFFFGLCFVLCVLMEWADNPFEIGHCYLPRVDIGVVAGLTAPEPIDNTNVKFHVTGVSVSGVYWVLDGGVPEQVTGASVCADAGRQLRRVWPDAEIHCSETPPLAATPPTQ